MTLHPISPPAGLPVTINDLRAQLRLTSTDEDVLIVSYGIAATAAIDGAAGWLGRALVTQKWELRLASFPWHGVIQVPLPPCQSVDAITYIDQSGAEQTLGSSPPAYQVAGIGGAPPARIYPLVGARWPSTRDQPEAVRITFTAGYGGPYAVPEPIKAAIMLMVTDLFEHRGSILAGDGFERLQVTDAAQSLLMPYRVW